RGTFAACPERYAASGDHDAATHPNFRSTSRVLITPTTTLAASTTNRWWTFSATNWLTTDRAGVVSCTEKTPSVIAPRTGLWPPAPPRSRAWISRSVRVTTPTGWPASSMTTAAPNPRSVRNAVASATVAVEVIDTGPGVIRSRAVSASSVRGAAMVGPRGEVAGLRGYRRNPPPHR